MAKRKQKKKGFIQTFFSLLGIIFFIWILCTVLAVIVFRWINPPRSSLMIYKKIEAFLHGEKKYHIRYTWVNLNDISSNMGFAVIAAEDQRFIYHDGFDFDAISETLERNMHRKRIRGASTISQQVAKNLFLWPHRTIVRKSLEAYFTILIEVCWPKQRILELYLNIVELGSGIFGVHEASILFFKKEPKLLSIEESALFAASLPNPLKLRIDNPSEKMHGHQQWIAGQMRDLMADRSIWKALYR